MLDPLYIAAATATGKTALAIRLAEKIQGEIINADAFQLYAGIPICTAQPSLEEQSRVPHHLFGILPSTQSIDAGQYQKLAQAKINEVQSHGHRPIIVGGSGLYLKSLTTGLADLPQADPELRTKIANCTAAERIAWLLKLDPESGKNVPFSNDRYVSRALEICLLTGQQQSKLRQNWQRNDVPFLGVLLIRERDALCQRIYQRVEAMLENGLVAEIQTLLEQHHLSAYQATDSALEQIFPTAHKAIGIRQITKHLRGETTLTEALDQMKLATRQYAKRQSTWFRREKGFRILNIDSETSAEFLIDSVLPLFD